MTFGEFFATYHLGDDAAAAAAAQKLRMKEAREARIRKSLVRWAEANPERAAKFFGSLLIFDPLMWFGDIGRWCVTVKRQGEQLRAAGPARPAPVEGVDN